ncbi:MAG: hypothetical protein DRI57_14030 [Deltaproteobacteria bacterium]|nr:MAG: hypothetical protein DRI57_14030 [Deltaproteobacteria bacterium]
MVGCVGWVRLWGQNPLKGSHIRPRTTEQHHMLHQEMGETSSFPPEPDLPYPRSDLLLRSGRVLTPSLHRSDLICSHHIFHEC